MSVELRPCQNEAVSADNLAPLLLTPKQAADVLALSVDGVRYLHRLRRLRGIIINRQLRFDRRDLLAYVDALRQEQC